MQKRLINKSVNMNFFVRMLYKHSY